MSTPWCESSCRLRTKLAEYYASEGGTTRLWWNCEGTLRPHVPPASHGRGGTTRALLTSIKQFGGQWPGLTRGIFTIVALSVVLASVVAVATDRFLNRRIAEARVTSDSPDVRLLFMFSGRASSPVPGAVGHLQ